MNCDHLSATPIVVDEETVICGSCGENGGPELATRFWCYDFMKFVEKIDQLN